MTTSFRFPRQLLHSMTEPQWLPRSKEEEGSRLDDLERDEEAWMERTRQSVLGEGLLFSVAAVEPIGLAGGRNEVALRKLKAVPPVDLTLLPPAPPAAGGGAGTSQQQSFWDRHLGDFQRIQAQLQQPNTSAAIAEQEDFSSRPLLPNDDEDHPVLDNSLDTPRYAYHYHSKQQQEEQEATIDDSFLHVGKDDDDDNRHDHQSSSDGLDMSMASSSAMDVTMMSPNTTTNTTPPFRH